MKSSFLFISVDTDVKLELQGTGLKRAYLSFAPCVVANFLCQVWIVCD